MPGILTYINANEEDVGSDDESVRESEESHKDMDSQRGDSMMKSCDWCGESIRTDIAYMYKSR